MNSLVTFSLAMLLSSTVSASPASDPSERLRSALQNLVPQEFESKRVAQRIDNFAPPTALPHEDFGRTSKHPAWAQEAERKYFTNPLRTYPPSCLTFPLPATPQGPSLVGDVHLRTAAGYDTELVPISIWRHPCTLAKSALLLQMEPTEPIFTPFFIGRQGDLEVVFRAVSEANTILQDGTIKYGGVYVFEMDVFNLSEFDFNEEFELAATYPEDNTHGFGWSPIRAYDPANYASSPVPLRMSGHLSGSYYDPTRSGEGLMLEVWEVGTRVGFAVSWYTFDADGLALWLTGATLLNPSDRQAFVSLSTKVGGRFAGNFQPGDVVDVPWGTAGFAFGDCGSVSFVFESSHQVDWLPSTSGSRTWQRLTGINLLACE